tara:strand:+ start:37 stop:561 length:525 start_codon:yes stop_codon:yes gene_type:complete
MPCCKDCGVELVVGDNWPKSQRRISSFRCIPCKNKLNDLRMYVNGRYIKQSHPLYKPGRYKSFDEAAFSSLKDYSTTKEGYVYVLTNPAWPDWVKVGMAIDAEDRCNSYQTSSPFRDYQLHYQVHSEDRRDLERQAHEAVSEIAESQANEWFKIPVPLAVTCITDLLKQQNSPQ